MIFLRPKWHLPLKTGDPAAFARSLYLGDALYECVCLPKNQAHSVYKTRSTRSPPVHLGDQPHRETIGRAWVL